jgi:hypothetical protein
MTGEGRLAAETHALGLRTGSAVARTGDNHRALELGQGCEYSQDQLPVRRRGIDHRIGERLESGAGLADRIKNVEQIARASAAPSGTESASGRAREEGPTDRPVGARAARATMSG